MNNENISPDLVDKLVASFRDQLDGVTPEKTSEDYFSLENDIAEFGMWVLNTYETMKTELGELPPEKTANQLTPKENQIVGALQALDTVILSLQSVMIRHL